MYKRILVPLDGSKLAERALPAAEELARLMQTPLHLVRVIDPAQWDLRANGADEAEGIAADSYLERMTKREVEQGIGARGEVRYGNTVREIVSTTQPGDLMVVSTW